LGIKPEMQFRERMGIHVWCLLLDKPWTKIRRRNFVIFYGR
jgi:hypothetical protein